MGRAGEQTAPDVAVDLADAMRKNPKLHVFSANGYFDLATPFFSTEYDLSHMDLPAKLVGNVQFGYYPAGHMVYLNVDALKELKADMAKFYVWLSSAKAALRLRRLRAGSLRSTCF